jgi:hypothetical protein
VANGSFLENVEMGPVFVCNIDFSNKSFLPGCKRFKNQLNYVTSFTIVFNICFNFKLSNINELKFKGKRPTGWPRTQSLIQVPEYIMKRGKKWQEIKMTNCG